MMRTYHVVHIAIDQYVLFYCVVCLAFKCPCKQLDNKWLNFSQTLSCQVLKSERTVGVSSPINGDFEEKNGTSCDAVGAQISFRKKSSGPSARKRVKSSQSESASSNAKNISESSDSENGPRQDAHPSPPKTKLAGKCVIRKRNSKRVAERVLACMQKRQKKMTASDSDSIVKGGVCPSDTKLRSNSCKENEDTSSSSHKNLKSPPSGRSRRKESTNKNSDVQVEIPDGSSNEMITDPPATSSDDNIRKEEFVDENLCKQESSDDKSWKAIEKGLFEKGVEIFGRNRSDE